VKLIMESWRRFLREHEEMDSRIQTQIDRLLQWPQLNIKIFTYGKDKIIFQYVIRGADGKSERPILMRDAGYPVGAITIRRSISNKEDRDYDGPCTGGWIVESSNATKNMGPLLYDVAMEWASQNGSGLMADRNMVFGNARAVWDKYSQRDGVEEIQLDIDHDVSGKMFKSFPRLTRDYLPDDCDQEMAVEMHGDAWSESSLSRVYRKNIPEVMTKLAEYGRLIDET